MIKKIKNKILAGFALLITILIVAGSLSIYEFTNMGKSVSSLIDDNYKTIADSKTMLEALEREDSGILLLLLGRWEQGREIIQAADSSFQKSLTRAENNITEENEEEYIRKIKDSYSAYKALWKRPIVDTEKEGNIVWYFETLHESFLNTKSAVNGLMELNQKNLYHESTQLKNQSRRAIMPAIIAIISVIIFSIMLNFFITRYFVTPIGKLTDVIKTYNPDNRNYSLDMGFNDEIKQLEEEILNLIDKITKRHEK